MTSLNRPTGPWMSAVALAALLSACGAGAPASSPAAPPASSGPASPAGSAAAKPSAVASTPASAAAGSASAKPAASTSAAGSAAAAAKPGAVKLMELTPTPDPNLSYALETQELGLFQKHGVNVEILRAGGGGPQKVQILVSGSTDVVMTDIISMYSAFYQTSDMTGIFAPVARFGVPVAAAPNITSVEQLKGKQVSVPSLAGAARFLMTIAFDHFGVKDQDIKWLAIPDTSESLSAIAAGRVPAGYISTAAIPLIQQDPLYKDKVHILLDTTAQYTPPWPNFAFITKKAWLQQNPDAAERIVEALLDMERTFANDQKSYATVAHKIFPSLSEEQGAQVWKLLTDSGNWAVNGGVNLEGTQVALDTFLKAQNQAPNKNLSKSADAFDTGPLKTALGKMSIISGAKDVPDWYKK